MQTPQGTVLSYPLDSDVIAYGAEYFVSHNIDLNNLSGEMKSLKEFVDFYSRCRTKVFP